MRPYTWPGQLLAVGAQGKVTFKEPLNVPPVNLPATFRVTTVPELPAEPGKAKAVEVVAPAARLPRLTGNVVEVLAGPKLALVILTLEALK